MQLFQLENVLGTLSIVLAMSRGDKVYDIVEIADELMVKIAIAIAMYNSAGCKI
jgi:hypothetical protein